MATNPNPLANRWKQRKFGTVSHASSVSRPDEAMRRIVAEGKQVAEAIRRGDNSALRRIKKMKGR